MRTNRAMWFFVLKCPSTLLYLLSVVIMSPVLELFCLHADGAKWRHEGPEIISVNHKLLFLKLIVEKL